jgi:hypothetical protein
VSPGRQAPGLPGPSEQQPLGQLAVVHRHRPLPSSHSSPVEHVPQLPPQPSGPHWLPWQCGTQTHWPFWHVDCAPGQFTHDAPPVPQACSVVPGWQVPFGAQHPGQLAELQEHRPDASSQVAPGGQLPQVPTPPQPSPPHWRPAQLEAQHNPSRLHWVSGPAQQSTSLAQHPVPRGEQVRAVPPTVHWLTLSAQTKLKQLFPQHWLSRVQPPPVGRQAVGCRGPPPEDGLGWLPPRLAVPFFP